jgi:hypothetical protein
LSHCDADIFTVEMSRRNAAFKYLLLAITGAVVAIWASSSTHAMSIRNAIVQLPKRGYICQPSWTFLGFNGFCTAAPLQSSKGSTKFKYRIAASYSDKRHKFDPRRNVFDFDTIATKPIFQGPQGKASKQLKETRIRPASGEDSFFVQHLGPTQIALGVADGVGGWASEGVDPAFFSHSLCNYMSKAAAAAKSATMQEERLTQRLLQHAYTQVMEDETVPAGGSTACVATLSTEDGRLEVAKSVTPLIQMSSLC